MKMLFVLSSLVLSFNLLAAERFVCQEYDRSNGKALDKTVVLTPLSTGELNDSTVVKYQFELFDNQSEYFPSIDLKGSITTEDVMADFKSNDGSIFFRIYLDELNESYLYINNVSIKSGFNCR